jgi:CheY-like chemotaxis protein
MSGHRHTVLLLEDHGDTRDVFVVMADMAGLDMVAVPSGREALARLRDGLRPCLILLDMSMPGMDGFAFRLEQLADPGLADIPVIAISAGGTIVEEKARSLGLTTFLRKPVEPDAVITLFSEHCGAHAMS